MGCCKHDKRTLTGPTRRDLFAGLALAGLLATGTEDLCDNGDAYCYQDKGVLSLTEEAWRFADAMIEADE